MNTCSVLDYGENLLAVYMMLPCARIYSPEGQLKKEIDIKSGHPIRVIRLPEGVYDSIAIEGDSIYAFNSRRGSLGLLKIRS